MAKKEKAESASDSDKIQLLSPGQLQPCISNLKACLFNLIIYTNEPRRAAYYHDIARMITEQFPCRIIFIQANVTTSDPYLRVQKQAKKNDAERSCDSISIEAGGAHLERIRYIILPYLVPDLPIYLLWGQDPTTENIILPHLIKFATRLVFDSENSENLQELCENLFKWLKTSVVELTDMNWVRIRSWREVLSQTFDNQKRIDQLNSSKLIKIIYNNRASNLFFNPQTQAFYLQAWLATQLKWKFEKITYDADVCHLFYRLKNHPIQISLEGKPKQNTHTEEILEFEASDQSSFAYTLGRKDQSKVLIHCNTLDRCELPFSLTLSNILSGKTFMQEIFYKRMSEQYFDMLRLIKEIPWGNHHGNI